MLIQVYVYKPKCKIFDYTKSHRVSLSSILDLYTNKIYFRYLKYK